MSLIRYDKLVRDRIPEIISNKGQKPITEFLEDEKYIEKLNEKLHEELTEYDKDGSAEELADLVEVVYAILDYKGIPLETFEEQRKRKALERGKFKKRILLKEVRDI